LLEEGAGFMKEGGSCILL